jgi:uncharacterized protein (DUF2235 family)
MKRIVICADGTWNIRDQLDRASGKRRPTNVTKLARGVLSRDGQGVDQVVAYFDGVGTAGGLDRFTGGAFGRGIEDNVRAIYRFLVYNYVEGDQIYLFGVSRGAFTVRTLVGFMNKVGLVRKGEDYFVPELYALYESQQGQDSRAWETAFRKIAHRRPAPPVTMLGVWDTVGALGAPGLLGLLFNGRKYAYHDVGLNPLVGNAYHAMALDERRRPFAVNLFKRPAGWSGTLEQAWFAGVHSDVGGSYRPDGLANEALHWMVERAERLGLAFDDLYMDFFRPCFNSTLHDSSSWFYKLIGEVTRKVGRHRDHGECLHRSVLDRIGHAPSAYHPTNVPSPGGPQALPVSDTWRIQRGTPCETLG